MWLLVVQYAYHSQHFKAADMTGHGWRYGPFQSEKLQVFASVVRRTVFLQALNQHALKYHSDINPQKNYKILKGQNTVFV